MESSLKPVIAWFLVLSVLLQLAGAIHAEAATGSSQVQSVIKTDGRNCGVACIGRCRLSKRPNLYKRVCGTCCARCGCVPPGTYGHFSACPCYGRITTRGTQRKCP